jgi:hypothetical protein
MTAQEMADAMLKEVQNYGGVTFVELQRLFGEEADGDLTIESKTVPGVIFWSGVSQTFAEAFFLLMPQVETRQTSPLTYLIDGSVLQLPVAKRLPAKGYKKNHWVPFAFYPKKAA